MINQFFKEIFRPTHPGLWYTFMQPVHYLLGAISTSKLFGIIPVDIIAHLTLSAAITHQLLNLKWKSRHILITILALGLLKEYFDSFRIGGTTLFESSKDLIVTLLYPCIFLKINSKKRRINQNLGSDQ